MKRLLIPFVAAFGLSLGIATGIVMVRTPKSTPASAHAASAKHATPAKPGTADSSAAKAAPGTATPPAASTPGAAGVAANAVSPAPTSSAEPHTAAARGGTCSGHAEGCVRADEHSPAAQRASEHDGDEHVESADDQGTDSGRREESRGHGATWKAHREGVRRHAGARRRACARADG